MVVPSTSVARWRLAVSRLVVVFFLSLLALLVTTGRLYAGTITITDGGNLNGPDTYSDEVIADMLETQPVTLDTADAGVDGPHDIRIEAGVEITWTSEFTLTLIAQEQIVVSGTIQHDGPGDGRGGVELLADGDVALGLGGSRAALPSAAVMG